jgi:hypothetical protein
VFERFTDRARRVLVLAQEEARLLGHGFIGTEHVLLGLVAERDGVAAKALERLDVSLDAVREEVEAIVTGSGATSGSPPFTPRAKKVLELALREAMQLGHNYIGTEHLLLGIIREGEGVAVAVLVRLGVELGQVRSEVLDLLGGFTHAGARAEGPEAQDVVRRSRLARVAVGRLRRNPAARTCSFCGRDLWEAGRHVTAGTATICEGCVATAAGVLEQAEAAPGEELPFPPRVFGAAPDDAAVDEIVAAFRGLFGPATVDHATRAGLEDLVPLLARAGGRHPLRPGSTRVERLRFSGPDTAEVVFAFGLADGSTASFTGAAVRRHGVWVVTRESVLEVLARAGVEVPPEPPAP